MNRLRLLDILFLTLAGVSCEVSMNQSIPSRTERASRYFDDQIAASKFPGVQYLVVSAKERIFEYDGGFSDLDHRVSMKPTTTMMAYSMTKTFTAVAVLQLVERGQIALDESVLHYLPSFPYGPLVTVRNLLSQTSGLPNPIPLRWVHPASQESSFDESDALQSVLSANPRLAFPPGTKYGYSNISYWLLGKIIEQVSGQPYELHMEHNVLTPLGLSARQAGFRIVDSTSHAKGYLSRRSLLNLVKRLFLDRALIGDNEDGWVHIRDHYLNGAAFGGLILTARGVSSFLQDQLRENSVLLNPQSFSQFYSQQSAGQRPIAMTLGWHIGELNGNRYFYKEGGGGGYHSEMRIYPGHAIGTVIMVNETSSACVRTQDAVDREFLK